LRVIDRHVSLSHGDLGETYVFRDVLRKQPDIIIMDLLLPSFDGLSLLHRLQEDHCTNHIPVIIYSTKSNKHLKDSGVDKGAQQFFLKEDFTPERLIGRVFKIY
jgi:CheY-like chemotaxis protein